MTNSPTFQAPKNESSGMLGYTPGVLMCLASLAAIAFPVLGTLAVELTTAVAFFAVGLIGMVAFFRLGGQRASATELITAIFNLIIGVVLLIDPLTGLMSMTLFVAVAFIIVGCVRAVASFKMMPSQGWGWVLADGVVSALLGLMLAAQFPFSSLWALGLLAGMNLMFSGLTWIAVRAAITAEHLHNTRPAEHNSDAAVS